MTAPTWSRLNAQFDLTEAGALYARLGYRDTAPYGDDPHAEVRLAKVPQAVGSLPWIFTGPAGRPEHMLEG